MFFFCAPLEDIRGKKIKAISSPCLFAACAFFQLFEFVNQISLFRFPLQSILHNAGDDTYTFIQNKTSESERSGSLSRHPLYTTRLNSIFNMKKISLSAQKTIKSQHQTHRLRRTLSHTARVNNANKSSFCVSASASPFWV